MEHIDKSYTGRQAAPEGASPGTQDTYSTIALCDKIEGVDLTNVRNLPLSYVAFFNWLKQEVYGSYLEAIAIPKNS